MLQRVALEVCGRFFPPGKSNGIAALDPTWFPWEQLHPWQCLAIEGIVGGRVEEDVLFLLLWAEAIWECVNLILRDGKVGHILGIPGSCHKRLLFLEDSHVQPCAWSGEDNICQKWEAESKPYLYSIVATLGSSSVSRAARPHALELICPEGLFTRPGHDRVQWIQAMIYIAEKIYQVFSLCRIKIEEEYAKNLAKLSQNSLAAQEEG